METRKSAVEGRVGDIADHLSTQVDHQTAGPDHTAVRHTRRRLCVLALLPVVAIGCMWLYNVVYSRPPAPLVEAGAVVTGFDKAMVFLMPKTWVGEPFPLADYIDTGRKLRKGKWMVLIYNHKSPTANNMLDKCEQLARNLVTRKEAMKVALVEAPPFGRGGPMPALPGVPCLVGRLSEAQNWVIGRPVLVVLENGVVAKIGD